MFEDGVQKSLSLTNTGGTLSRYHVKVTGNEPGVPGVQQTSAAPYWHTLRPSSYDTKRTVSETISELPEDAGAAFFISADTFVTAEAGAADTNDDISPQSILEQDLAVFNTALAEAGVDDVSVDVKNYYLIADDEGGFWASDDVMAKADIMQAQVQSVRAEV